MARTVQLPKATGGQDPMSHVNRCQQDLERRAAAATGRSITEHVGEFIHRVEFIVGYDHRAFPADCGRGGHGQHGMDMVLTLQGPAGAVSWTVGLGDLVPGTVEHGRAGDHGSAFGISTGGVVVHSATPLHGFEEEGICHLLPAGRCWSTIGYLLAKPILEAFAADGLRAVWALLTEHLAEMDQT